VTATTGEAHRAWRRRAVLRVLAVASVVAELPAALGCRPDSSGEAVADFGRKSVPTVTGREASASVLRGFLEPAPEGFAWSLHPDWDDSVAAKCLTSSPSGTHVPDELVAALMATAPPAGYELVPDRAQSGRTLQVCVVRIGCRYGKEPGRQECNVPR